MIKKLFTVLLAAAISSCGSSKKMGKDTEVLRIVTTSTTMDSSAVIKHNLITEANLLEEDVEVIHVVYDTLIRSPADPQKMLSKTVYRRTSKRDNKKEERRDYLSSG